MLRQMMSLPCSRAISCFDPIIPILRLAAKTPLRGLRHLLGRLKSYGATAAIAISR